MSMKSRLTSSSGTKQTYVDDVFSTWLYTGNGSTQTINNGIDLAGNGGLVWLKDRNAVNSNSLSDTINGSGKLLVTNSAAALLNNATTLTSFTSTGFSLGSNSLINLNAEPFVSWTFRKAAKFFDIVTYTGDGVAGRNIAHNLGSVPGCIIVKSTSAGGAWWVYHKGLSSYNYNVRLNTTDAQSTTYSAWGSDPTSTYFNVNGASSTNENGTSFVAYLFAHDTTSTGIIQCGSVVAGAQVNLGWEPQYLMVKPVSTTGDWQLYDSMRGLTTKGSTDALLYANTSGAEIGLYDQIGINSTGFTNEGATAGVTYIYIAIRRPNKPPTSGTQVYQGVSYTGDGTTRTLNSTISYVDAVLYKRKSEVTNFSIQSRLQGKDVALFTNLADAETGIVPTVFASQGFTVTANYWSNSSAISYVGYSFKRAPTFFDIVCYTGASGTTSRNHNLGVTPELLIARFRTGSAGDRWCVYCANLGINDGLYLDTTDAALGGGFMGGVAPTTTTFSSGSQINVNGATYVAYLFATLAGISKVGSYTGNGTTQTINCGFSTGARFFLVKATSTTGSWWVYDSARGIIAANDPALQLNSTAAEITSADAVDPDSSGIIVNQEATCSINASGVSYIYLAIA